MITWKSSVEQREWIALAVKNLAPAVKKGTIDTLIASGGSGTLFAYPLGVQLEIPVLIAGRDNDSHPGRLVNSVEAGEHIVFVDDHFSNGGTFTLCRTVLARFFHDAKTVTRECAARGITDSYGRTKDAHTNPFTGFSAVKDAIVIEYATKHIEYTYMYGPMSTEQGTKGLHRCDNTHPRKRNLYGMDNRIKCPFPDVVVAAKPHQRERWLPSGSYAQ